MINLVKPYILDSADLLVRWSEWALQEVAGWSGTSAGDGAPVPGGPAHGRSGRVETAG